MSVLPLNEVKTRFSALADEVAATHDRVVVTRNGKPHVMVIAVDDFESLQLTREILATPGALDDIDQESQAVNEGRFSSLDEVKSALDARRRDESGQNADAD